MNRGRAMTIDRWIIDAAARHTRKTAIAFGDRQLSYGDIAKAVDDRAAGLLRAGVSAGDRIAWYGLNHPDVFVLLFAAARIGAILVPLNWRLAEPELADIIADCAPKLVFHDAEFAAAAGRIAGHMAVPPGGALPDAQVPIAQVPVAAAAVGTDAPLLIVYTSGSTGAPKGAVLSQAALIANAAMGVEAHALTPDDRVLNVLPLFHVGGLNILPTPAFSIGATVVLHQRFDPETACRDLQSVDAAIVVPTVLQAMMATPTWADMAPGLGQLRVMSIGSTDVPRALIDAVHGRGVPMIQIYGATETAPYAIYQRIADAQQIAGSIGRVGSHCDARLDPETGEIQIRGANTLDAYWNNPQETASSIIDGWFRTGDVARVDADGVFWFTDRLKHVIISGGENIYPAEIERVLRTHPGIREAAVVGRHDPRWGAVPVAVVVRDGPLDRSDVLAHLDGKIARYKRPRDVVFLDALPRNAMGKVVAAEVRRLIATGHQGGHAGT